MAYEQNHINGYNKDDKKKTVAFIGETLETMKSAYDPMMLARCVIDQSTPLIFGASFRMCKSCRD